MNILIIEDEPHAQRELIRLIKNSGINYNILECIDSIEDAVKWLLANLEPDLIFLDIQLSDGLSFDIFNQVKINCPVIFTTAYDEYAIQAFKLNSIDYLLKPIRQEGLNEALKKLSRIKERYADKNLIPDLQNIEQLFKSKLRDYKSRIIARVGDQIKHLSIYEIAYFYAEDNVVFLASHSDQRMIIEYSLEQLERSLNPREFFRINRSYLVSIKAIGKINKYFNSRLKLELIPETEDDVLISRVKVSGFLEWMDR
jgi:DNA-binding LytR/AlgR family response regulator